MDMREITSGDWPAQLMEIPQPPKRLWMRGAWPPEGHRLLTVVGSRAMTRYGQEACQKLIGGLAGYPVSIVSGLALGTDACAHRAALDSGLHTIAIPGSGLDDSVISPRANLGLARDILAAGSALISEQEPLHKPWLAEFPSRNRLMVGLSDAVLVIEGGEKSGTLITARLAGEYNRELLCIPHRINDPHAFGPHLFIRLGAALVTEPLHILEALRIPPREDAPSGASSRGGTPADLEETEAVIWEMLAEPKTRDEVLRGASGAATPGGLLTALVSLELRGLVREESGAWRRA